MPLFPVIGGKALIVYDDTVTDISYVNGLPHDQGKVLAQDGGTIVNFSQGIAITEDGAISTIDASTVANPVYSNGLAFSDDGRLLVSVDGVTVTYSNGIPLSDVGGVCI